MTVPSTRPKAQQPDAELDAAVESLLTLLANYTAQVKEGTVRQPMGYAYAQRHARDFLSHLKLKRPGISFLK
jgi:hypothetical protein